MTGKTKKKNEIVKKDSMINEPVEVIKKKINESKKKSPSNLPLSNL